MARVRACEEYFQLLNPGIVFVLYLLLVIGTGYWQVLIYCYKFVSSWSSSLLLRIYNQYYRTGVNTLLPSLYEIEQRKIEGAVLTSQTEIPMMVYKISFF